MRTSLPTPIHHIRARNQPIELGKYHSTPLILIKASNHIMSNGKPKTHKSQNQLPHKSKKKLSTSNNAVGFASTANAKNNHESISHFDVSGESLSGVAPSRRCSRKNRNQLTKATSINVRTPMSVLLSIKTRNAPIPLDIH